MPDEVVKTNGSSITSGVSDAVQVVDSSRCGGCPNFVGCLVEDLPTPAVTAVSVILSGGFAAALLEFIYLCFKHPDGANILIPLILIPLAQYAAKAYAARRAKVKPLAEDKSDADETER